MPDNGPSPSRPASFRVRELAGCTVVTEGGERLGTLDDVWPSGGNDIFVVREGTREILLPALKNVVLAIDLTARRITVALPPGLRDIYE